MLNDIRPKHPNATKCIYFSDGASSKYKNCKDFINLCHHNSDHGLPLVMTKAHVMAQGVMSRGLLPMQVISTTYDMFQWCQDNVSGISFFYVSSKDINKHVNQSQLDHRYELTKTVPGTRSYHSFIPDGLFKLIL